MHQYGSVLFEGKPGFYLSNASNFNATIGSTFSTIPAWISYGLISTSLQLLQSRNGSYAPSDGFAVDYARLDRCLKTTAPEPYPPLQVTIRLAGSEPIIAEKSLLGRHIFVVVGNSSSLTFMSPPVYLDGMFSLGDVCVTMLSLSPPPLPLFPSQFKMPHLLHQQHLMVRMQSSPIYTLFEMMIFSRQLLSLWTAS